MSGKHIVMMDDEKEVLEGLINTIEDDETGKFDDFTLHTVLSPKATMKKIEEIVNEGEEVYILVVDYSFPARDNSIYGNGLDIIRETRRRFPKIRIILLSTQDSQDDVIGAMNEKLLDAMEDKRTGAIQNTFLTTLEKCIKDYDSIYKREKETMLGNNLLVTGVTGFVGKRLIKELLEKTDVNLYLLGRSKGEKKFANRVGIINDRIRYIEGDLSDPMVVENKDDVDLLEEIVEEVWHLAALTDFDERYRAETMRINLLGTANLLSLAKRFKRLNCFNYVSTAYVTGEIYYPQKVDESMPFTKGFKNPYEESKYYAECIVRNSGLPFRIFRPSMIVGDSKTGECDAKTIYGAAIMLYIAKARYSKDQDIFTVLGDHDTKKNIIPLNSIIDMMLKIRESDKGFNEAFSLVNPVSTTVGEILDTAAELQGIKLEYNPTLSESKIKNMGDAFLYRALRQFRYYMTLSDPNFDMKNTMRVLPQHQIPEPNPELLRFYFKTFYKDMLPNILKKN